MTRSRHRRSEGSGEPASLPSWAQRHLDESGTSAGAIVPATRHRRPARPAAARGTAGDSPLRGWGVAILSVAAAVTAVPLAISAVANDRSDDPMPTVDTFTAGAPGPLQGGGTGTGVPSGRGGTVGATDDPATAGVLPLPGAPEAVGPGPVVVPAPLPAAVVRSTTPPAPTAVTPRSAAPKPTTTTPSRTTTSSDEDDGEGRSTTPPKSSSSTPKPSSGGGSSSSGGSGSGSDSSKKQDGPVTGLVKGVGNTLGGVTGSLGL